MNTYIITYTATDNLFRGISNGQKFSITANTANEAIIAFYKKNLAPLCFSASNGRIYNNYGEVVQTGDDWIQYGNGRFTAELANEQPNEAGSQVQSPMERLLKDATNGQKMMQDSVHFYHAVYSLLAGHKPIQVIESLCEAIMAQNEQIKRMADKSKFNGMLFFNPFDEKITAELQQEVDNLKADKEVFERLSEKLKQAYSDLQQKRLDECVANGEERQKLLDEVDNLKAENEKLKAEVDRVRTESVNTISEMHRVIRDLHEKSSR